MIENKQKQVDELVEDIKNAKTFMIVSIKNLPSKQFQEIKKSVRDDASVKLAKKNIVIRALKKFGKESILQLEDDIKADIAFVISGKDGYELAGLLAKKKTPVFARVGQIAEDDIEVKDGPTDLVPGPAISELGALGIQIAVEDGKISIKQPRVVANKGQEISGEVASILQKLNIQPFSIGLNPLVIYDIENEEIYRDIKIDSDEAAENLASSAGKALGFAQKIVYYCKETIGYLLGKANLNGEALSKLNPGEEAKGEDKEENKEGSDEESKGETGEEKTEDKAEEPSEEKNDDGEKNEEGKVESDNDGKGVEESEEKKDDVQLNKPEESA
ncbi:50S ribosomal protein L10 [Candidatus Pacearchaeota archaeon]|nr:50S ribosomal protein L10 [Candidatus Pacearchaeota archaeon]|tara:strand:- start:944 stop:1936 length:993 start_codon:yes stop_codon:yes gene_type:complete